MWPDHAPVLERTEVVVQLASGEYLERYRGSDLLARLTLERSRHKEKRERG